MNFATFADPCSFDSAHDAGGLFIPLVAPRFQHILVNDPRLGGQCPPGSLRASDGIGVARSNILLDNSKRGKK